MERGDGGESRERLTRSRIYEAALAVIDRDGIDALSMRSLARELGVKAGSLYYHFEGKEELLDGLTDSLYLQLRQAVIPEKGWTAGLSSVFLEVQRLVHTHPNSAPLLLRRLFGPNDTSGRLVELLGTIPEPALEDETSAILRRNLVALLVGHSLMLTWSDKPAADERPEGGSVGREAPDLVSDIADAVENGSLYALMAGMDALVKGFAALHEDEHVYN